MQQRMRYGPSMAAYGGDVATFYLLCLFGWAFISFPFALVCKKAGRPMWIAFVPWYSFLVELEIAELPLWWLILAFVPLINIWIYFKAGWQLGRSFGRGTGFCFG